MENSNFSTVVLYYAVIPGIIITILSLWCILVSINNYAQTRNRNESLFCYNMFYALSYCIIIAIFIAATALISSTPRAKTKEEILKTLVPFLTSSYVTLILLILIHVIVAKKIKEPQEDDIENQYIECKQHDSDEWHSKPSNICTAQDPAPPSPLLFLHF